LRRDFLEPSFDKEVAINKKYIVERTAWHEDVHQNQRGVQWQMKIDDGRAPARWLDSTKRRPAESNQWLRRFFSW